GADVQPGLQPAVRRHVERLPRCRLQGPRWVLSARCFDGQPPAPGSVPGAGSSFVSNSPWRTILRIESIAVAVAIGLGLVSAGPLDSAEPTKATFLVTGLHCPPCTSTVQNSLTRVNGVKSVSVDWNTKSAKITFDESVLPAQALASAIETTPHMMGAGMRYGGWLYLKVPSITDQASGQKAKETLSKVEGVKSVAVYPAKHSVGVLFAGNGKTSSQQMIDALAKEGIEAANY